MAASVDGAVHGIASVLHLAVDEALYRTCTLLSMIFTVGTFNSVILLTGGGPADLTHVGHPASLSAARQVGMRWPRSSAPCAVLPLVYFMMKRLQMRPQVTARHGAEAALLLVGLPVCYGR